MNGLFRRIAGAGAVVAAAFALSAAAPSVFAKTEGGLWEVARSGAKPVRLCLADTSALAQFEHRSRKCERTIIKDGESEAVIHYICRGGDFGQTRTTLLTPRSLRLNTQGISGGAPFQYVLQARRVGNCNAH